MMWLYRHLMHSSLCRETTSLKRARFNRRSQFNGESAEQYITTLYALAENCGYKNWKMNDPPG